MFQIQNIYNHNSFPGIMASVEWNPKLKLIISDVDETIADLYVNASTEMIQELEKLLEEGRILFLISGQGIQSIKKRIIDRISTRFRKQILVGHCSGTEVIGFDQKGNLNEKPFYSLYDRSLSNSQKITWRRIINQLISEFRLKVFPAMPIPEFTSKSNGNPLSIMLEDRGPQITFEVINGYLLSPDQIKAVQKEIPHFNITNDLRIPIIKRAEELLKEEKIPVTPRLAGVFAVDFVIEGVSKTTAVRYILGNNALLAKLGLSKDILNHPDQIEVWGDKFSVTKGGTDRHISQALPKETRSITFREENPKEFLGGYKIVVWDGKEHLHQGLLEFLKTRKSI